MTENLLQKLEERMMTLLAEVENSRKEIRRLTNENTALKNEIERHIFDNQKHSKKVEEILMLIDTVSTSEAVYANVSNMTGMAKPTLIQGDKA